MRGEGSLGKAHRPALGCALFYTYLVLTGTLKVVALQLILSIYPGEIFMVLSRRRRHLLSIWCVCCMDYWAFNYYCSAVTANKRLMKHVLLLYR